MCVCGGGVGAPLQDGIFKLTVTQHKEIMLSSIFGPSRAWSFKGLCSQEEGKINLSAGLIALMSDCSNLFTLRADLPHVRKEASTLAHVSSFCLTRIAGAPENLGGWSFILESHPCIP